MKAALSGILFLILAAMLNETQGQNPCSAGKMRANYNEMRRANCQRCDKYFHCQGNFEAVHRCSGILQRTTAKLLSDGRELFGGDSSGKGKADSDADQAANNYGRSGGNCAARYLRAYKCAYNPSTRRCQW